MTKMVFFVAILFLQIGDSLGQVNTVGREAAYAFNQNLGRGINFMATKINLNQHAPADFKLIRENHFMHVRLGSRLWQHVGTVPDFTINATKLQEYKNAVDWALAEDLMVVLDPIHWWREYSDADLPMLLKMWNQLAGAFADYPTDRVAFEIMNEPHSYDFDLEAVINGSLEVIRGISGNEERIVIVAGQAFSTRKALINAFDNNVVFPTDDPYLIGTFHYYDPRSFSKQGEAGNINWANGGDDDPEFQDVVSAFEEVVTANANWASRNATTPLPIYCGEYGIDNGAPFTDRIRWLWWVKIQCEERGFSQSLWNLYNNAPSAKGFGPWTSREINDPLRRSLDQPILNPYRNRYELEDARYFGEVTTLELAGNSGTGVAAFNGASENSLQVVNIYIGKSGRYELTLRYQHNNETPARVAIISKNNNGAREIDSQVVTLPPTNGEWIAGTLPLDFQSGQYNQLVLKSQEGSGLIHFDFVAITSGPYLEQFHPAIAIALEQVTTGILSVDNPKTSRFKVYPNPAFDSVMVEGDFKGWRLLSSQGNEVAFGTGSPIAVSQIPSGVYILMLDQEKHKIIIW